MKVADRTRLTERMHLMLSKDMKSEIAKEAEKEGVAIAEVVRFAIEDYLEKKTK